MFVNTAFGLVAFLAAFGGLFLWLAKNEGVVPNTTTKRIGTVMNLKTFMVLLSLFYFALAHFTMYGALALGLEYDNNAPCENVVRNSTTTGNVTTYYYVDSCASVATPPLFESYFTLFTYLLYIDLFALALGTLVLTFRFFGGVF